MLNGLNQLLAVLSYKRCDTLLRRRAEGFRFQRIPANIYIVGECQKLEQGCCIYI